ncbi:MAG: glycosyltransferase [Rhodospirillales bacterium]|nr:glycosyltransferase [Rhodospirillales bacterium]
MAVRVALLLNEIPPYRVPLLEALAQQVDELRVFISTTREPDRPWATDWGTLDVVVQRTVTITRRRLHPQGYCQTMYVHVPYDTLVQLVRYKPDVIISGEMGARSIQAAIYRRLAPSSRLLIWCTLSEISEAGWSRSRTKMRRMLVAAADGFVAGGQSGRRYLRSIGAPDSAIFIANQTVDIDEFSLCPTTRSEGANRRMLYCGRFIAKKGLQAFQAEAASWAARNPDRTVSIRWVGDGETGPALKAFVGPPNLLQEFPGAVGYEGLRRHYAECGILILPTLDDEWGLVVNEAFAAGLPVLGTVYSQAVQELVDEGKTGWIYDPHEPNAAAHALGRVFGTSDAALAMMRGQARTRIRDLTPQNIANIFKHAIVSVQTETDFARLVKR